MRIFLTGATGFIGSHILPELLAGGHIVLGLTRSERGARALAEAGAEPHLGDLGDLDSLRAGADRSDAVIHTAFDHDFENFPAGCAQDERVIGAMGEVLRGSERPLILTSAVGMGHVAPGEPAREDVFDAQHPNPRIASERAGNALLDAGVDVRVMRLPQVHDRVKQGLITPYIALSRAKGVVAYVGDGANHWSAGHVSDAARLYALALDKGVAGARYHAVAEEGIAMREIAGTVAAGLGLPLRSLSPEEAPGFFGWFATFAGMDMRASSALTRAGLGWQPTGPGLIADLAAMDYADAA